jgi:cytochrome-b5 reductase
MSSSILRQFSRPSTATILGTAAATGLGLTIYTRHMMAIAHAESSSPAPKKVFGGGFANVVLPLESSEQVNHNTKRLRFRLKEDEISGLPLTCK